MIASFGLRRGRAADPSARVAQQRDEGRERRGEGMINDPPSLCRACASATILVEAVTPRG